MKYLNIFFSFILFLLAACGGSGSSDDSEQAVNETGSGNPEPSLTVSSGIYFGSVTPSGSTGDDAISLFASDGRVALLNVDSEEIVVGTISENANISGTLYTYQGTTTVNAEVTSSENGLIQGNYSSSAGNGTYELQADTELYERGFDFSSISGIWVDSQNVDLVGVSTWSINDDGSFDLVTSVGCVATGQISAIDLAKNEFSIQGTIMNCGEFDGAVSGLGFVGDVNTTNDALAVVIQT